MGGEKKMANEKIIAQKEKEVNELADKMKAAKIILLTDYRGITVICKKNYFSCFHFIS